MTDGVIEKVTTAPVMRCLVAMVDIRGYSEFAHAENDPVGVAAYVETAIRYTLSSVADSVSFANAIVKPTGDGLLFVFNLEGTSQAHMASAAQLILTELQSVATKFKAYLEVNPPPGLAAPPTKLGVGVTFGTLVRVTVESSDNRYKNIDDYIGHAINLAARLQELARNGGCVVHADVYEKLLKHNPTTSEAFRSTFGDRVEVRLRGIVGSDATPVYTSAEIPVEYLTDEQRLEDFASDAMKELEAMFPRHRLQESPWKRLPEGTRFVLFKRETDSFREAISFRDGQRQYSATPVTIRIDGMEEGANPIADAVLTKKTVVVGYSVRFEQWEEVDPDNEYWKQTLDRFPRAKIETLRKLRMHPSSIISIPIPDRSTSVAAVAAFDVNETNVFNESIASEMAARVADIYERLYGSPEPESDGMLEL